MPIWGRFFAKNPITEEDRANARLVAAAPDMFDALIEAREALDHFADLEVREHGGDDPCQDAAHALASIDAAIAKVKGEAK